MFCHVGELASSKSAMKQRAPELSALMTIFGVVGPVISTRRSRSASGTGAICQSRSSGSMAVSERAPLRAGGEQAAALAVELGVQAGDEPAGAVVEEVVSWGGELHRSTSTGAPSGGGRAAGRPSLRRCAWICSVQPGLAAAIASAPVASSASALRRPSSAAGPACVML